MFFQSDSQKFPLKFAVQLRIYNKLVQRNSIANSIENLRETVLHGYARKRERERNNLKSASVFFAPKEMKRTGFRVLSPSGRTVRRATIRLAEFDGKILLSVAVFRILLSLLYFPRLVYVSFNRAAAFITGERLLSFSGFGSKEQ